MKKFLLLIFFFTSLFVSAQTDTTDNSPIDNLTPDQILDYFINEPEPPKFYKGPDVGDSVFYVLRPLTVPTETVEAPPLSRHGAAAANAEGEIIDTVNRIQQRLKPKISFGIGSLGFHGDLYQKHFQSPVTGRPGFNLGISQRLTRYLQLDFTALFGKLGANEWLNNRHENFQSEIRAGGVNLVYDFGNFIPDKYSFRPFVSLGVLGFEFLSKTDLRDKNGNLYHYWSDGTIRNMAEGSAGAQNSILLNRDYKYESDIRELNKDGFGKYPERAWAFPIGFGVIMKVTDRVDVKMNFQYYVSTTDYIDGITSKGLAERKGTKGKDNFMYSSVAFQYDLIAKYRAKNKIPVTEKSNSQWLAIDKQDKDNDGIPDLADDCAGTPEGAKVNLKGCPLDEDGDGIPNFRDDELNTPPGVPVDARGVAQSDEYWKNYREFYLNDSIDLSATTEVVGNIYDLTTINKKKKKKKNEDVFTVELARYSGAIPTDELAFLLSIGDINSATLDDGTTVVYTTGNYDNLANAVKRRDEFRGYGNKNAGISRIKGKKIIPVSDDELAQLLKGELEDLVNTGVKENNSQESENFNPNDIVYRVQLGAFRNRISTSVFNTSAGAVLELKTGENIYRYVTKGYKTIENAASVRADLVVQGYSDAFVTAYRNGKRIPLSETNATVDKEFKEDLTENKMFSSVDKTLVSFKIQLGPLKKRILESSMDEKVKELPAVEKQTTSTGSIRYTSGKFATLAEAEAHLKNVQDYGITDAFLIATFKDEVISKQEAMELLSGK